MSNPPPPPHLPPPDASLAGLVNQPANFGLRLVAYIIDSVVTGIIFIFAALVIGSSFPVFGYLMAFVLPFWYWIELEGVSGQTLGKRAMNIRVVRKGTQYSIGRGGSVGAHVREIYLGSPLFHRISVDAVGRRSTNLA